MNLFNLQDTFPCSVKSSALRIAAGSLALTVTLLSPVHAQSELYWNPGTGGSGNWDSSTAIWSTNSGGPADTSWSANAGTADIARFASSGGVVSLLSPLGAGGLRFDVNGYEIKASDGLTEFQLNGDRTLHVGADSTATLGADFRLMAPGASGDLGFEKTGAGTLVISGPTGSDNHYFGAGYAAANTRRILVSEGTLDLRSASLSNTQNIVEVASGAVLDLYSSLLNIGGIEGDGIITSTSATNRHLYLRGKDLNFSGLLTGNLSLWTLNAPGGQTLSGSEANTFTGFVSINFGSISMAKDAGVTAISGDEIRMNGGNSTVAALRWFNNEQVSLTTDLRFVSLGTGTNTVDLNGHSERMGDLILDAPGTYNGGTHLIDFGDNTDEQYLWFAGFIVNDTEAPAINIANFIEGQDSLRFDADPTANLAWLKFQSEDGLLNARAWFDAENNYWVVTAIPEPATYALLGGFIAAAVLLFRRRSV